MLTDKQIRDNMERFFKLINEIKRPGSALDELHDFLSSSDFFFAPASTQYHCAYQGGLCEHSLHVYDVLVDLCKKYAPEISQDSIIISALCHDFNKINLYEKYIQNKKVYSPNGSKRDEMGSFDWKSVKAYKVKDATSRKVYGDDGFTSYVIASRFLPLTDDEILAIVHHHGNNETAPKNILSIFNQSSLTTLSHLADMIACYVIEKVLVDNE